MTWVVENPTTMLSRPWQPLYLWI